MRRRKTETLKTIDRMHRFEQLHKWTFAIAFLKVVPTIQIHDLTEQ